MVSRDLFRSLLKQQGCRKGKESKKTRQAKSHPRHSHRDSIYRLQRLLELDEIYVDGKRTGKRSHDLSLNNLHSQGVSHE